MAHGGSWRLLERFKNRPRDGQRDLLELGVERIVVAAEGELKPAIVALAAAIVAAAVPDLARGLQRIGARAFRAVFSLRKFPGTFGKKRQRSAQAAREQPEQFGEPRGR